MTQRGLRILDEIEELQNKLERLELTPKRRRKGFALPKLTPEQRFKRKIGILERVEKEGLKEKKITKLKTKKEKLEMLLKESKTITIPQEEKKETIKKKTKKDEFIDFVKQQRKDLLNNKEKI
jgi:hypothetical protein